MLERRQGLVENGREETTHLIQITTRSAELTSPFCAMQAIKGDYAALRRKQDDQVTMRSVLYLLVNKSCKLLRPKGNKRRGRQNEKIDKVGRMKSTTN